MHHKIHKVLGVLLKTLGLFMAIGSQCIQFLTSNPLILTNPKWTDRLAYIGLTLAALGVIQESLRHWTDTHYRTKLTMCKIEHLMNRK